MSFADDLQAAHNYLLTAAAFPGTYQQVKRQQFDQVMQLICKSAFTTREANQALMMLGASTSWEESQKEALATAVQERQSGAGISAHVRQSLQDFSCMSLFFPEALWTEIMQAELSDFGRCSCILQFLGTLGLRNPTETTIQFLTSLLLHLPDSKLPCKSAADLHQSFLTVKKSMKTYLGTLSAVPTGLPLMDKLPSKWQMLDGRWKEVVFKNCKPALDAPVNLTAVVTYATQIPMRISNKQLNLKPKIAASSGSSSGPVDSLQEILMRLAASIELPSQGLRNFKMMIPGHAAIAEPQAHGSGGRAPKDSLALSLPLEPHKPEPLALPAPAVVDEDIQNVDGGMHVDASAVDKKTPMDAAELLRSELAEAKGLQAAPLEAETKVKSKTLNSNAASNKAKKSKSEVRPKAKAKAKAKPRAGRRGKRCNLVEDRKLRLAAGITSALLKKFQNGCISCRSRPLCCISCWKKRGFQF